MSIAPEIAELLPFDDEQTVNHMQLAAEAQASTSRLSGGNGADRSKWSLSLGREEFGWATTTALDYGRYNLKPEQIRIDDVHVNPARNHLGMLAAIDTVQRAYPHVVKIDVNPFIPAVLETLPSVAPHLEGWDYIRKNGVVPVFALVRRVPELRPR